MSTYFLWSWKVPLAERFPSERAAPSWVSSRDIINPYPVCAKQKLSPSALDRWFLFLLLGFLVLCAPAVSRADALEDSVRALARKGATSAKGATISIAIENRSALGEQQVRDLRGAFEDELRRRSVGVVQQSGGAKVILTFSENTSGYLGILQLQWGEASETWIESLGHPEATRGLPGDAGLRLQRERIFASDQPILDLIFSESDSKQIDVLRPLEITSFQQEGDRWRPVTVLKLPRNLPIGRELRGQIIPGPEERTVVFPNETCNLSIHNGDHCRPNSGRLPLSEVPSGFVNEKESPAWIMATQMQSEGRNVVLAAGKDGLLRVYGDSSEPLAAFSNFGDQVAGIHSDCGSGWQALVTQKADRSKEDRVEGIEIRDRKPVVVTEALEFPGPVVALRHADRNVAKLPSSAMAIIFNLETGLYEAYRLSIVCAN